MRIFGLFALLVFFYLVEESVVKDLRDFGEVISIEVDERLLKELGEAVEGINVDSIGEGNVEDVIKAAQKVVNASVRPLQQYGKDIRDGAKELATSNQKQ